jgi:hypothetical protein
MSELILYRTPVSASDPDDEERRSECNGGLIVYRRTLHGGRHESGPRKKPSIPCLIILAQIQEPQVSQSVTCSQTVSLGSSLSLPPVLMSGPDLLVELFDLGLAHCHELPLRRNLAEIQLRFHSADQHDLRFLCRHSAFASEVAFPA